MGKKRPKTELEYKCIDGNWTRHPVAYCSRKKGVVTEGLINTHHCTEIDCIRLHYMEFK